MIKKLVYAVLGFGLCAAVGVTLSLPAYGQVVKGHAAAQQAKPNTSKSAATTTSHSVSGTSGSHTAIKAGSGTGTKPRTTTMTTGSGKSSGTSGTKTATGKSSGTTGSTTTTGKSSGTTGSTGTGKSFGTTGSTTGTGKSFGRGTTGVTAKTGGEGRGGGSYSPVHSRGVPPGGREIHTANGGHATFDRGGRPRDVQARGMDIHHGPGGSRMVVRENPGHVMVVSNRYGHGYISRPYTYRNVEFVHRTYYVNGMAYSRFYRPFAWGGLALNVYAPGAYFASAYYGWAYHPWATPVVYGGWGWAGRPWYGYYGGWFAPYPRYAGPAFWLTDYLVSQTLMAAYQERAAELAAGRMNYAEPMSPAVKDLVAAEVQRQLALENAEASAGAAQTPPDPGSSGVARMLSDGQPHVFVVNSGLDVASTNGECSVTEGDVLQLAGSVQSGAEAACLTVLASKGDDCSKGTVVQVQVADLQEMQNHMRETLDQGLAELQKTQGQGGIPSAPQSAMAAPQQTAYAAIAPPPDPNVSTTLSQQTKEGDQAEQEVLRDPGGRSQL